MPAITELVVYDSVLFGIGHNVRRWADGVERRFTANAILHAPVNKRPNKGAGALPVGALKASIHGSVDRIGPTFLQTTVSVDVPYALAVIEGTGPITPKGAPYLKLPYNPGYGRRTRFNVVSGQRANNFLGTAQIATARFHPSIRSLQHNAFQQF